MKLVNQSFELLEQEIPTRKPDDYRGDHFREEYIKAMNIHIERCGRTCYKSQDKITAGSADRFVNSLIKSKHLSVLEHGVIYLDFPHDAIETPRIVDSRTFHRSEKYYGNYYSKARMTQNGHTYVTTSYRVIIENGWEDDLYYLCEPTEWHEKRHTVLLHTCIHVYKDLTRHRKMSFSIESTRYCNYAKEKFGGEIKFVKVPWFRDDHINYFKDSTTLPVCAPDRDGSQCLPEFYFKVSDAAVFNGMETWEPEDYFLFNCMVAEWNYMSLIEKGWQAQKAAEVLPQCTAADVIMSGFDSDWQFVFDLRSDTAKTGQPHPLVKEIMTPLRDTFIEKYGLGSKEV